MELNTYKEENYHHETINIRESLKYQKEIVLKLRLTYMWEITLSSQAIDASSWNGSRITVRVFNWGTVFHKCYRKEMIEIIKGKK